MDSRLRGDDCFGVDFGPSAFERFNPKAVVDDRANQDNLFVMENSHASEKQDHPDGHQIRARQQTVEAANSLPLLDAAWKVIFYNRWRYRLGRPPYPDPISFGELEQSWEEEALASAISRAKALYDDAYGIGDVMQHVKFEKKACRKATAEFVAVHPGFSERTIDEAISHGCYLAR